MTRGELTYLITNEQVLNYNAYDTTMVSEKLFRHDKDTTVVSVKVDTLIYSFEKDYVVVTQKGRYSLGGTIIYDFEKMKVTVIAPPQRFIRDSSEVTVQYSMFDDIRFTSISCDTIIYSESSEKYSGSKCIKTEYNCDMYKSMHRIVGHYTELIRMDISVISPIERPGPCPIKVVSYNDNNNSKVTVELLYAEAVSPEYILTLRNDFKSTIYRYENDIDSPGVRFDDKKSYKRQVNNLWKSFPTETQKRAREYVTVVQKYVAKALKKEKTASLDKLTNILWQDLNLDFEELNNIEKKRIVRKICEIVYKHKDYHFDSSFLK
jgi:hypothetical protein